MRRLGALWLLFAAFGPLGDGATTYHQVASGVRCENSGYADILTNAGCQTAATALSLPDTTVCASCPVSGNTAYPNGCAQRPSLRCRQALTCARTCQVSRVWKPAVHRQQQPARGQRRRLERGRD